MFSPHPCPAEPKKILLCIFTYSKLSSHLSEMRIVALKVMKVYMMLNGNLSLPDISAHVLRIITNCFLNEFDKHLVHILISSQSLSTWI